MTERPGSEPLSIVIMGAGAMGSALGGFMARGGHRVALVGRPAHMKAVSRNGLRITGIWGDHVVKNLLTATDPGELSIAEPDVVFITVKSYDTEEAVRAVLPRVGPATLVCSFQNGLGNAETIARFVGWERTVGARVIFGVRLKKPGAVEVTVIAEPTALGVFSPKAPLERVRDLAEAMDKAGLPTVFTDNITVLLWSKVAYNAALNPLSALLDVPYGVLLEAEESRAIMEQVVRELYAVAQACGVHLDPPSAATYIEKLFTKLIPSTAAHYASMREDFAARRRTEIDALNGAIVRLGKGHGIACPANDLLTKLVKSREKTYGR